MSLDSYHVMEKRFNYTPSRYPAVLDHPIIVQVETKIVNFAPTVKVMVVSIHLELPMLNRLFLLFILPECFTLALSGEQLR